MKNLSALIVLSTAAMAGSNLSVHAKSFALETGRCLFELSAPVQEAAPLQFSWAPMTASRTLRSPVAHVVELPGDTRILDEPIAATEAPSQFSANFIKAPRQVPEADAVEHWRLFEALRRWQNQPEVAGLSHTLTDPHSYIALDYSDIFETGRAAYKGGHGVSLFLRHNF